MCKNNYNNNKTKCVESFDRSRTFISERERVCVVCGVCGVFRIAVMSTRHVSLCHRGIPVTAVAAVISDVATQRVVVISRLMLLVLCPV